MIKYLVGKSVAAMKKRYDYDAGYLLEVAEASTGGVLRLGFLPLLSQYQAGVPVDVWAGAAMASTRDGDCGPCLQLVVNAAIEKGADTAALRAALQGDYELAGDTGLGYRFGLAAIRDGVELDPLRDELQQRFGEQSVISLSIAAATGRAWPVIKRGLGHGRSCQAVTINDVQVDLVKDSAASAA
jgi:hypothetical protein